MQSFLLPTGICSKIDDTNKRFFWNKQNTSYHSLLSWDAICRPKSLGGLGIHKAEHNIIALQLKLLWRILCDQDNFWVKIITEKYFRSKNLFSYKSKPNQSWQFSRLLKLRNLFTQGIMWELGNGKSINFWTDKWILDIDLLPYFNPTTTSINSKVADFIINKQWDYTKLLSILPSYVVKRICQIYIPNINTEDRIIWKLASNGIFSTKSAHPLITRYLSSPTNPIYNKIWNLLYRLVSKISYGKFARIVFLQRNALIDISEEFLMPAYCVVITQKLHLIYYSSVLIQLKWLRVFKPKIIVSINFRIQII